MTNIIDKYRILLHAVPRLIEISGYKNEYIAQKLDMTPTHFSAKKSKGNWSIDEVEKILKTISNEDVEDFLDDMVFEKCFPGKLIDSKQFEKRMGWK
ncbi:hypothetical protein [Agriterribacter sp.]|uniref:hypothetical protein n=1 Tax=Agriterribacter sp. TaxID=2821509 RepID=UPI002C5FEADF|nr:hypothetical protein [Agriterribacter sp.]HRP56204.1 hypothetical protein [Agriterribacter sp.]